MGAEDTEADGDTTEFDFKSGPGVKMTKDDVDEVEQKGPSGRQTHHAHIFKKDFEKHGYTIRCPGCSTIFRKMKAQPHTGASRKIMSKSMKGDARFENARRRKEEHEANAKEEVGEKRKILQDLEDKICSEQDLSELDTLYKEYAILARSGSPSQRRRHQGRGDADDMDTGGSASSASGAKRPSDMTLDELEASINNIKVEMDRG